MTTSPDMRAGDDDRDRTITQLREAFSEGRLSDQEFQDRLGQATAARTFGELAPLTADLPATSAVPGTAPATSAVPGAAPVPATRTEGGQQGWRKVWGAWLASAVVANVIWAATWLTGSDGMPYYWPIWVWGPWGAVTLVGWLVNRGKD